MENGYISLSDAIRQKQIEIGVPKFKSQRAELFNELYSYYEKSYRKNAWTDYRKWLMKNHYKHSKEKVLEFKKQMYPKISIKSFCSYWFSFIPTEDLYYLVSICKDKDNRGENINKWLFWAIKY